MKKRILLTIAILLALSVVLGGCFFDQPAAETSAKPTVTAEASKTPEPTPTPSVSETPSPEPTQTPSAEPEPTPTVSESGTLGNYGVKILTSESVKDYKKKDAIRINFEFTNNSQEAISFVLAVSVKASQEGTELKAATMEKESELDKNAIVPVEPGMTQQCSRVFKLNAKTGAVDVELKQFFGFNEESMIKKSFPLS
jgi:cytoskeletal protein RodZ